MFNSVSTATTSSASFAEKSVAELLSSLASGNYAATQYSSGVLTPSSLVRGIVATPSTPLLTPNSLTSLEQIIGGSSSAASSGATDLSRESGFVPPLVQPTSTASALPPVKQEFSGYSFGGNMPTTKEDPDWEPSSKRVKMEQPYASPSLVTSHMTTIPKVTPNSTVTGTGSRRPTGPRSRKPHVDLSEEEMERRDVRRERNKLAAAKCRQRRVDITNTLLNESEGLEEEQANLEDEIEMLRQQKEQLEFLLEAHRPLCAKKINTPRPNSLSLPCTTPHVTEATGISISTPSGGMSSLFSFGLDAMLEGHTGLTPVTEGTSCASQVQRAAVLDQRSSSSGSDTLNSPTLMAL